MRPLGVGAVYLPALEPLFERGGAAVPVLELEPQTLWSQAAHAHGWCYRDDPARLERIAALPCAKLVHGIGQPLGGSVPDPIAHDALLRQAVDRLDPAWCSEHLSFNRIRRDHAIEHAGFLLPPPQTAAAARLAADNIRGYGQRLGRPVAFETGVNYLRRDPGDLDDGDWFAAVARESGCGILLDLHNLWCNERNGRAPVAEVLSRLPLDQVWEIHLAGGMEMHGYWLDAHSGAVPDEVLDIAARLVPALPNLGAIVYEILPEQLPRFGIDAVHRQIESLHALWSLRAADRVSVSRAMPGGFAARATPADVEEVAAWETDLVDALRGARASDPRVARLRVDPGCRVLRELVDDARRSSLAQAMRYTVTLLLLALGRREALALLDAYLAACPPEPFNAVEADRFARFLQARLPLATPIPYLQEVLAFERALLRAALHGASSEIEWTTAPEVLLGALDAGRLPEGHPVVTSRMQVCAA